MENDMSDIFKNVKNLVDNGNIPDNLKDILNNLQNNNSKDNSNNNSSSDNNITPDNLSNILSSFSNSSNNNNNENNENNESNEPSFDINTLLKIKSIMNNINKKDDPRANLLYSLKPYLRNSRKNKIDQYVNLLNMSKIADILKDNNKENNNNV